MAKTMVKMAIEPAESKAGKKFFGRVERLATGGSHGRQEQMVDAVFLPLAVADAPVSAAAQQAARERQATRGPMSS